MTTDLDVLRLATGLMRHAGSRQELTARNIANADTPGYKARELRSFEDVLRGSATVRMRSTRPGHLSGTDSDARPDARIDQRDPVAPNGNSVSLEREMLRLADIRQQHDLALTVYRSSLGVLRNGLGRR